MADYKTTDPLITLSDIKALPQSAFPMMVLTNGYSSVFGFLISLTTKDFWNHFMWLISPFEVAGFEDSENGLSMSLSDMVCKSMMP